MKGDRQVGEDRRRDLLRFGVAGVGALVAATMVEACGASASSGGAASGTTSGWGSRYQVFNVRDYGAVADGSTDDTAAIQKAIYAQQASGGVVWLPAGTYRVDGILLPAPQTAVASHTCVLLGEGMDATTLRAVHPQYQYNGMIGYQGATVVAAVVLRDLTLDGNYVGAGGTVPQRTAGGHGALVSLPQPFTGASNFAPPAGRYHVFERVRFYRPAGYGFQPPSSSVLLQCVFEECGQPDAKVHYDNIGGGGQQDCLVSGCSWLNGAGNFVDFVAKQAGKPSRLRFIHNTSFNHSTGGIYAAGIGSIICGNDIGNTGTTSSGIGYDVGTAQANRGRNLVFGNSLSGNLNLFHSGLSAKYGDRVFGNSGAVDAPTPTGAGAAPVSGNTYRNEAPYAVTLYLAAYAHGAGPTRAGAVPAVVVELGAGSTLQTVATQRVPDPSTAAAPQTVVLQVPSGWSYRFTAQGCHLDTLATVPAEAG